VVRTLIRALLWSVILIGAILAVARLTAFRWFRLPVDDPVFSASTRPTLWEGDLVLTWRIVQPTFGDLVVCPEPNFPSRIVIGRIVGEAGDKVVIHDGVPTTNGKPYQTERGCDPNTFTFPNPNNEAEEVSQNCGWEAIANHLHMVGSTNGHKVMPADVAIEVPEGKLFLLSDNRVFPYDSRDFGLADVATCKETIIARLVSKNGWMDSKNRLNYIQ
jgi:signal peptidase I